MLPITLGSFKSLSVSFSPAIPHTACFLSSTLKLTLETPKSSKTQQKSQRKAAALEIENEDDELAETLRWEDSIYFPVFGSVALMGLWGLLKYLGKDWLNFLLGIYCT